MHIKQWRVARKPYLLGNYAAAAKSCLMEMRFQRGGGATCGWLCSCALG
jgi:hypothetical protein